MKVSIVIPTWNGEDTVAECLRGVFEQEVDFETEVLVIDSSSTDRTVDLVRRFPVRFHPIAKGEFDHGDTRNLGARLTDGDFIVFLVQDAYPERRDWLRRLVSNFADPAVGGAFSRIVPRPTAGMLVRKGVQGDLCFATQRTEHQIVDAAAYRAMDPLQRRIFVNFNDVASCLRRSAWERLPFARVQFGEDLLWAKGALEAGYKVVFDPDAPVVHSHEYDPRTLRSRTRIDAWLNRAYLDRECINRPQDVLTMTARVARADRRFLAENGVPPWKRFKLSLLSVWYHFLEFSGFLEGSRTPDRLRAPQAVGRKHLKIVFVVHGFPPETYAGTEVLTLSLAKALAARGHEVVVFHRVADPALPNYALRDGVYDGLRTIQIANHLRFQNIEETYRNPHVEQRFREILERERPDVVHFEHLIHLSASLPMVCREFDVASVLTLNDFWFRCPRVQLIRPDQRVCEGKPPVLGCAACVANRPRLIGPARALSRPLRKPLAALARRYLALARKAPRWFKKHASDIACIAQRPAAMLQDLAQVDFVIAPSPFLKQKMVEAGFPRSRLIVSDYGMETSWLGRYRRRPAPGRLRIGFIGSLVWYKGLEVLARAFQRLADPRAELHIHGDFEGQPEFRETRARVEAHAVRPGLEFHGRYRPEDLPDVLAGIDVLVVPSLWFENSPLAIHEAFQARIPVVVSDRGGMADLVSDGRGGFRFRPGDDADLARVLQRFLDDAALAERVGGAAPAVKTVADNAAEMELKYKQAIGMHRAHSALLEVGARSFARVSGSAEPQGAASLLLRPAPGRGSVVEHRFATNRRLSVELGLRTVHAAGEESVIQGGEVRINGRRVLLLPPRPGAAAAVRDHFARVEIPRGAIRVEVSSRVRGIGGGSYFLRFDSVSLHRTASVVSEE